jgi:hypothetical protein
MLDEDASTDIDTNLLQLRLVRRRVLTGIRTLCVIAAGLGAAWFFLDNLKDSGWARLTTADGPGDVAGEWQLDASAAPTDGTAAVEVRLLAPGQLWVDTALVTRDGRVINLHPGVHRITAHFKDRLVTQQLRTLEGEVYHVEFGETATAKRIAPK